MTWILLLLTSLALAEESTFEETEEAGQKFDEPESELSVEAGATWAIGNTDYYTVNALLSGAHRFSRNKLALELGANLGKSVVDSDEDGILSDDERAEGRQETARKYWADGRYDRFIGERDSLYALVGALADPFAGYDYRIHEQLGYSRILVENSSTDVVTEIGADMAHEDYVEGVDPNWALILAGRIMVGIDHKFNENVSFSEKVELYENILDYEDLRILNEASISAQLSDVFSMKLSNSLTYDNVPVEGYRPLDLTSMATLVASIL